MELELLLKEAKGMNEDALIQVVHYMRFLKWENRESQPDSAASPQTTVRRQPGMYHGTIQIADDFDAPLDDFREYMQ